MRITGLAIVLAMATALAAFAQEGTVQDIKHGAKKAGEAIKDGLETVGEKTKEGAKTAGRETKRALKKAKAEATEE